MKRILIVDDQAIVAEPLAIVLRHAGYQSTVVTSARDALKVCRSTPPDLVVCDIDMPQGSGIDLLRDLRLAPATASIPVMMLTGFQDSESVRMSVAYGVCDYLIKSEFTLERFLQRISRHFSTAHSDPGVVIKPVAVSQNNAAHSSQVIAPEGNAVAPPTTASQPVPEDDTAAIRLIMTQAGKHTFRGVVRDILRIASSSSADFDDLAVVLRRDPVLAAQCIATSNAAAVKSGRDTVTSLVDAARLLGFGRVKNIAATLGIFAALPQGSNSFDQASCWQHCIATALILERLAGPDSYLIGLCHDLGEVLVHEALSSTPEAHWIDRDSGRLRRLALENMGLPQAMLAPMIEVLNYDPGRGISALTGSSRQLAFAHWYAHALGFSWSRSAELPEIENASHAEIAIMGKIPWEDLVNETMLTTMQVIAKPPAGAHVQLMGKRVLYIRGNSPQPSPLSLALSRWSKCVVKDHLPAPARDYADIDVIIIAGGTPQLGAALAAAPRIVRTLPLLVVGSMPNVTNWLNLRAVPQPTLGALLDFMTTTSRVNR